MTATKEDNPKRGNSRCMGEAMDRMRSRNHCTGDSRGDSPNRVAKIYGVMIEDIVVDGKIVRNVKSMLLTNGASPEDCVEVIISVIRGLRLLSLSLDGRGKELFV